MYIWWIFCLVTIFLFLIFLIELSNLYYIKRSFFARRVTVNGNFYISVRDNFAKNIALVYINADFVCQLLNNDKVRCYKFQRKSYSGQSPRYGILITAFSVDCPFSDLEDSVIVGKSKNHLRSLRSWLSPVARSVKSAWKRCWRASVDGWAASTFHSRCDSKGPTVTIIRVGRYIFGGYTSISWGKWAYKAWRWHLYLWRNWHWYVQLKVELGT